MIKLFNKGYTLAEVLVSLTIVGVVASLVVPKIVQNSSSLTTGVKLAKTVELVQTGTSNLLLEAQKRSETGQFAASITALQIQDLFGTIPEGLSAEDYLADGSNMFDYAGAFLNTIPKDDYNIQAIRNFTGAELDGELLENTKAYSFKKNNAAVVIQDFSADVANAGDTQVLTRVFIDANGGDAPNRLGRDIFLFGLSNNGHLIPAGSEAYNNNVYDEEIALYSNNCTNANITDGLSCAARVMTDGWKINY